MRAAGKRGRSEARITRSIDDANLVAQAAGDLYSLDFEKSHLISRD